VLELDEIIFNYGENNNFSCNYSLKLEKQDSLGIIGPSGAGKSALLSLVAGFMKPKSGVIKIDSNEVTNFPPSKRPVTMLFQEHNLFSHLNVYQNVAIGINPSLILRDEELDIVSESLDRVGLKSFNKRYIYQLSGGQKQRVAIARSLVRKTPILLLDEPFSFLDPPLKIEMLDLVKGLQKEQKFTLIMVTHDFNDCLRICNKSAFLDHGKILRFDLTKTFQKSGKTHEKIKGYVV
jgi:thiamine transport system ATP-binding protein